MREEAIKRGWPVYRGLKGRLWYGVPGVGLVRAATARRLLQVDETLDSLLEKYTDAELVAMIDEREVKGLDYGPDVFTFARMKRESING